MTTYVPRSEWGAKPRKSGTTSITDHPSITDHYVGGGWEYPWNHSSCDDKVRAIQADHMAPESQGGRGWSDIAYNELVCPHDYVYEGRGYDRRSSANGSDASNFASFAVCALWGTNSADDPLPDGLKRAFLYAHNLLRTKGGANHVVKGHRDWKSTSCPGDQIYAWIQAGCPSPDAPPEQPEDDMFTDQDRGRLNWLYGQAIDGDGSPSVLTQVNRVAADVNDLEVGMKKINTDIERLSDQYATMQSTLTQILNTLNNPS